MFEISNDRKKYCDEWNEYFDQYRNIEFETKINNNELLIEVYKFEIGKKCKYDFEHTYKDDDSFDCLYNLNKTFKYLFKNGYKYVYIDENSKLYKMCEENNNSIIHSPYKTINKKTFMLEKNNKLYCIVGRAFLPNKINKTFFGYVGTISNKKLVQTTIYDYL